MSSLKQHMGVWFPSHEEHMCQWMQKKNQIVDGKGTYQYHKLEAAMKFTRRFRVAVDIGAHVGLWSMHLANRFEHVHAFEPISAHRECFAKNVPAGKYTLYTCALGESGGMVSMTTTPGSSGDSKVTGAGGDFTLKRLDDVIDPGCMDFNKIDFIKVDCEGYEIFALKGGEALIRRNRPTIIVEQKPGFARRYGAGERGAVEWLQSLGAVLRKELGGDFILSFPEEEVAPPPVPGPAEVAAPPAAERIQQFETVELPVPGAEASSTSEAGDQTGMRSRRGRSRT